MRHSRIAILATIAIFSASQVDAHPREEGQSPGGLGAWWLDPPGYGRVVRLRFSMAGAYDSTVTGKALVHLPPGLRLLSGDTLYSGHPGARGQQWTLSLVPELVADYEIRASLRVSAPHGTDESDMALAFHVGRDTAWSAYTRTTRLETIRGGQRYRYGGQFLVPISGPESVTSGDIEHGGAKAKAIFAAPARCPTCETPSSISYVVLLNEQGEISRIRPRWATRRIPAPSDSAARAALRTWRFAPSRAKGRPVADWLIVDVPVHAR